MNSDQQKMNGAAKKRKKWLMQHGHSSVDARRLALQPFKPLNENGFSAKFNTYSGRPTGSRMRGGGGNGGLMNDNYGNMRCDMGDPWNDGINFNSNINSVNNSMMNNSVNPINSMNSMGNSMNMMNQSGNWGMNNNMNINMSDGGNMPFYQNNRGSNQYRSAPMANEQNKIFSSKPVKSDKSKKLPLPLVEQSESIRIVVLPNDFPNIKLDEEQLQFVQDTILEKVIENKNDQVHPKFHGCEQKRGGLIISCMDIATERWLKEVVEKIKVGENISLKTYKEKDIRTLKVLIGIFPKSVNDTNEKILSFVQAQNKDIDTSKWEIVDRFPEKQNDVQLIIHVDLFSLNKLKRNRFNVHYKYEMVHFKVFKELNLKPKSQDTKDASSMEEKPVESAVKDEENVGNPSFESTIVDNIKKEDEEDDKFNEANELEL